MDKLLNVTQAVARANELGRKWKGRSAFNNHVANGDIKPVNLAELVRELSGKMAAWQIANLLGIGDNTVKKYQETDGANQPVRFWQKDVDALIQKVSVERRGNRRDIDPAIIAQIGKVGWEELAERAGVSSRTLRRRVGK